MEIQKYWLLPFLFYLLLATTWGSEFSPLIRPHPFTQIKTQADFAAWCKKYDQGDILHNYSLYFEARLPSELELFLFQAQRVLRPGPGNILWPEDPSKLLVAAFLASNGQLSKALEHVSGRYRDSLPTYRAAQMAFYQHAFGALPYAPPEDRTLSATGRPQMVLMPWQLPLEAIDGDFERSFYAARIAELDPTLGAFTPDQAALIAEWTDKYKYTLALHYSGHNTKLKEMVFADPKRTPRARQGSIDDFVQTLAFMDADWWHSSDKPVAGEDVPAAEITGRTPRSLLRRYGPDGKRVIFWPLEDKDFRPRPVFGKLHIALNYDAKRRMRSIEVLAKDQRGEVHAFLYEKIRTGHSAGVWLPALKLGNAPIEQVCLRCHGDVQGRMHIRPTILRDRSALEAVGYKGPFVIDQLMMLD